MGSLSIWHWLVVAVVVMVFFGRGKITELMGDMASGIDRKSTRLNSSHRNTSRMPSSA